jgi:hypothetical protein
MKKTTPKRPTAEKVLPATDIAAPGTISQEEASTNLEMARRLFEEAQAVAIAAGVASPAVHVEKTHSASVWVGCKLPNGLMLQLHQQGSIDRPVVGGGIKTIPVHMRVGEMVRLRGSAIPFGAVPRFTIEKGYALTEVKREFWEKWAEQNKSMDLLKEGIVFVHSDKMDAEAEARDKGDDIMSGLEPLNPNGDPRVEKTRSPNLADITTDPDLDAYKHVA